MSNFYCAKIIKEIIYENYLQLTPSYGVVILDLADNNYLKCMGIP